MNNIFVHTCQTKAFLAAGLGLPFLKIVAGKADPIPQVNIFIFFIFTKLRFSEGVLCKKRPGKIHRDGCLKFETY